MPSAIELSVRLGLPVRKVKEICAMLDVELDAQEFETDKEFEAVARSVKRKRSSCYALAFLAEYASSEQRAFVLGLDPDFAAEYATLDLPIAPSELLDGAKVLLDTMVSEGAIESRNVALALAQWCYSAIRAAGGPVGHSYLATRLLLSLPPQDMVAYPQTIAAVLNRLRHRGFLDGWFSVQEIAGKNAVVYSDPATQAQAPSLPWLTAELVQGAAKLLGTNDIVKVSGYLAATGKTDFEPIKKALENNPALLFSAIPLDL